jgi:hypothetical protein
LKKAISKLSILKGAIKVRSKTKIIDYPEGCGENAKTGTTVAEKWQRYTREGQKSEHTTHIDRHLNKKQKTDSAN